jgi:hypothetical protein
MKLAVLAFFGLLVCAHGAGNGGSLVQQPLSMFRDGPEGWLGYALFAALLLISWFYTAALTRCRREAEADIAGLAGFLLLLVAVTPSQGSFHILCSLGLLLLVFSHYGLLLYRAENFWWFIHLALPVALALATCFHSYGVWQKSLIAYLVLAAAVHHHLLVRPRPQNPLDFAGMGGLRVGRPRKRRKVYQVESGREWARSNTSG